MPDPGNDLAAKRLALIAIALALLAGCAGSRHFASGGQFGGVSLVLQRDGRFEYTIFSDVVDENCVYAGTWERLAGPGPTHRLTFLDIRALDPAFDNCNSDRPRDSSGALFDEYWTIDRNKAIGPSGREIGRATKRAR